MKKIAASLMLVLISLNFLGGCTHEKNDPAEQVQEISISYVKLPLNIPSIIEKHENLFEKEFAKDGIKISFPEITQGSKMTQALAAGDLDFCNALGGTSAILAAANGVDLKIIGIYSRAPKAFTIMAINPDMKAISDLKGRTVAGPKGTILHQLLLGALEKVNQRVEDISFVNMGIPESVSAMFAGSVDAALVAGPDVTKASEAGAHIITTGEGILDATIVIAVNGDFLKKHPEIVQRYLDVHQKSLKFMKEKPAQTIQLAARETGLSLDEVKTMLPWYDFNPTINAQDLDELKKTQNFLVKNMMLEKKIELGDIIIE